MLYNIIQLWIIILHKIIHIDLKSIGFFKHIIDNNINPVLKIEGK
jgi:hypothetical protein